MHQLQKPNIFFDGVCAMCNTFVNLALRIDRKQLFLFAPLQGTTAKELLPPLSDDPREWSMIYLDEQNKHVGYEDVFTKIDMCRAHYAANGLGADYVDQFVR